MREFLTYGSVRGVPGNRYPYRDHPNGSGGQTLLVFRADVQ